MRPKGTSVSSKSSTPEEQKPKGNFDESGKFVPSPRGNYGTAMKELIARHNDLVDASALLWDPEVIAAYFRVRDEIVEMAREERANLTLDVEQWT